MERPIIDKTGLTGLYDFLLQLSEPPDPPSDSNPADAIDGMRANTKSQIPSKLEEQLGLRLVSSKGPVEVIVIDRVQKPTVN